MKNLDLLPRWFIERAGSRLSVLYGPQRSPEVFGRLVPLLVEQGIASKHEEKPKWSERDAILICYGDSIRSPDETPLHTLHEFVRKNLSDVINCVHILPFFPYSSDDGFAVVDYQAVNSELGDWDDIENLSQDFGLMMDLVINHVSREHPWFVDYLRDELPGRDFFIELPPDTDVSMVVRPRNHPLLTPVHTRHGVKYLWATFSEDQIDLNFSNPDVLLAFVEILLMYVRMGARFIRLDAVAFLWKTVGTRCIHLRETHEVVKLLRDILEVTAPHVVLLTETNVPNGENLSYFGHSDEAHMVYQFTLPPLLLHAMHNGTSQYLTDWSADMPRPPKGCTYMNFVASHDGIGLRPTEGLLPPEDLKELVASMHRYGGFVTMRSNGDGTESPYEINISLFDALSGTRHGRDAWQVQRFVCCQTIMFALQGIPALYIHSLTATPNDRDLVDKTGRTRSINRHKWESETLNALLANGMTPNAQVFDELRRLLSIRRKQAAFHPDSRQETLRMGHGLFGVIRESVDGRHALYAISNVTDQVQSFSLTDHRKADRSRAWYELIRGAPIDISASCTLQPYQTVWISG
ncbi:MAG: sugar phosphorylase [Pseudomonadota bacterium]|nr:sugar phosphorylase [Pseudomonadota bacterium]